MAACNHPGTQSGPSGLSFLSIMARCKQDDRNTGCTHTYYCIRHLHLHSASQEAEQSDKETPDTQMTRKERNQSVIMAVEVKTGRFGRTNSKNANTRNTTREGKRKQRKAQKGRFRGENEETRGRMETTEGNTGNAQRKGLAAKGDSVQACKHSYILPSCNRSCYLRMLRFHDNTCKKAFRCRSSTKGCKNEKRPHNANRKVN